MHTAGSPLKRHEAERAVHPRAAFFLARRHCESRVRFRPEADIAIAPQGASLFLVLPIEFVQDVLRLCNQQQAFLFMKTSAHEGACQHRSRVFS